MILDRLAQMEIFFFQIENSLKETIADRIVYDHGMTCWKWLVQIFAFNENFDWKGLYSKSELRSNFSGMWVERWPTILHVEMGFSRVIVISEIRSRFHQKSRLKRVIHTLSSRNKYRSIPREEFFYSHRIFFSTYPHFQRHSNQYLQLLRIVY